MDILDIIMAKKLSGGGGGGSDAVVENAKITGGIGWTESGGQTTIEWDGNTEGKDTLLPGMFAYKITDSGILKSDIIGSVLTLSNGEMHTITEQDVFENIPNVLYLIRDYVYSVVVDFEMEGMLLKSGVYFAKTEEGLYVSSLAYGASETIHKINEKYIPEDVATKEYVDSAIGNAIGGEY